MVVNAAGDTLPSGGSLKDRSGMVRKKKNVYIIYNQYKNFMEIEFIPRTFKIILISCQSCLDRILPYILFSTGNI